MVDEQLQPTRPFPSLVTRRAVVTRNIRAIATLAASAVAVQLATLRRASALLPVPCFQKGTKIATVLGEKNVEELRVGDLLPTVFGGTQAIQWIGRFRRAKEAGQVWGEHALPVRVLKSALAPDIPHRDLYVTGEHALFIDGMLVTARRLINGTTIAPHADDACDELEFFHIKLATHDVICAEGALCETLLRVEESVINFAEYVRMHGVPAKPEEPCAPIFGRGVRAEIGARLRSLMSTAPRKPAIDVIRDRLDERAVLVG